MQHNIIDYSHHAVHYIPVTYLFYNWKFVPLETLHPFCLPPNPLPSGIHHSVLCICEFDFGLVCLFIHLFCVLDSRYMWNHMIYVFTCVTYFTQHNNTLKVHSCFHKISFFFSWLSSISVCVCVCVCVCGVYHIFFIHLPIDGHLGCFHILVMKHYYK